MIFILMLISIIMVYFSNVFFYCISLIIIAIMVMITLVSMKLLSVIMSMMILIVYIGAMMIMIGYVCAICPNFTFLYMSTNTFMLSFFISFMIYMLLVVYKPQLVEEKTNYYMDFLLSEWGFTIFLLIMFMLFFTLLMVTSQFISPHGPFRSLN